MGDVGGSRMESSRFEERKIYLCAASVTRSMYTEGWIREGNGQLSRFAVIIGDE